MGGNRCVAHQVHYDFLGCTLTLQKYEYVLFYYKKCSKKEKANKLFLINRIMRIKKKNMENDRCTF